MSRTPEESMRFLTSIIEELRDTKARRGQEFADFRLSEIATETGMDDKLKNQVKLLMDNPDKEIKPGFKPK
jgi:hypothetical protein